MYTRGRARLAQVVVAAAMVIVPALTGCSLGQDRPGCDRDGDAAASECSTSGKDGSGTDDSRLSRPTTPAAPAASPSRPSAPPMKNGTAVLTRCATPDDPYATLRVHNPNTRDGVFSVSVSLQDTTGSTVAEAGAQASVPAKDTATVRIGVASTGRVDTTTHCTVDPQATFDW
ncbi:hypothetical protein ACIQFU_09040 [Streptomyces sp. NPDC093065]|uniref:hypothetical protein n=1 Tax=Streptomyces sp. NPDC093065 TaxID=3366021 RepID=UPI0037F7507B